MKRIVVGFKLALQRTSESGSIDQNSGAWTSPVAMVDEWLPKHKEERSALSSV
jgi:hypothetical protein